ncbi:CDP-glucose 4,6-dehydratase [Sphingomonas qomolangmaensis]|uniref:CDP-glucose 4,6-dehydratase n=1 Tax=Sphingomonas qomolangmaensis TaxID=2918765 RepID=A0ABY5L5E0_9SPHN|nr:CDP-glucose 4,6-dehydratase [Sphingomonas qomolangmaensis]UUL82165.1 CDP-glucose 4,6-dehydratase [Sphingomonas qomolangmaensis]
MEDLVMGLVDPTFWCGRRVFMTGHTGFKGSWLSLWLQDMGAVVTGYALTPVGEVSLFDAARVADGMRSVIGDIRDLESLRSAMAEADPEIVIHMAAQPLVRLSYRDPLGTYETNVMGTAKVLEAARAMPALRAVVSVTTDKCYENQEWDWGYRENEPMGGHDPYSNSKGCAELVTSAYRASFFAPGGQVALASARAGNVIGGGDWAADRIVPDAMAAFAKGEVLQVRNPNAIRPWQHVLEPLSGYLVLAQALWRGGAEFAEGWNFGPGGDDAQTVAEVIGTLQAAWGAGASWQHDDGEHPHEARYLKLDTSKARNRLGWRPVWSVEHTLERIVAWHRSWLAGNDMRGASLGEIKTYRAAAVAAQK